MTPSSTSDRLPLAGVDGDLDEPGQLPVGARGTCDSSARTYTCTTSVPRRVPLLASVTVTPSGVHLHVVEDDVAVGEPEPKGNSGARRAVS